MVRVLDFKSSNVSDLKKAQPKKKKKIAEVLQGFSGDFQTASSKK